MNPKIRFLGGAGTVTGSKFLIEFGRVKVLVDCGLFQGLKALRLQNWAPFPVPPSEIDAVILTHAHLDHSGYLPLLLKSGFRGKIYATEPTRDLTRIILMDSGKIQEEDAARANALGFSKHHPARPLYGVEDAVRTIRTIHPVPLRVWREIAPGVRFRLSTSGHILGSSLVELQTGGVTTAFSGDLGRTRPSSLPPADFITDADYLVVESTYGDRLHSIASPSSQLARVINHTFRRGGMVLVPAFAIGRTQDLLRMIAKLKTEKKIPDVPVFLDSPMGMRATEVFVAHPKWHRLDRTEVHSLAKSFTLVSSHRQSEDLLRRAEPAIVIAGSGMLTGGRILAHLAGRLSDARNSIVIVGFQAPGTRGSLLLAGIRELKIYGRYVPVGAEVVEISSLSAHADQSEILAWLAHFARPPKNTFIVHGEPQAADALRVRIQDRYHWNCTIPRQNDEFELTTGESKHEPRGERARANHHRPAESP